ncbi:hypothetical protein [Pseudonocardia endophytica]|uniref:Uncharacterized protein n=1 Tax=Pseudonocardia endophytica TaxID=401976 RepID=A0A4R1HV29_PSEEN|nr:hypothetical protein [Pseudonocardia endophytica]TCK26118.1 hypothetical protein EV378_1947 [Pseudonocardia endophytica]
MTTYATTSLDPATVGLTRLRAGLLSGSGPAGFDALAGAVGRAADTARDVVGDLDAVLRRDAAVHAGPAADGARTHLAALRQDVVAAAGRLERASRAVRELAAHHAAARRDIVPDRSPSGAGPGAALLGAALDDGGDRRARLAVAAYQDRCNAVLSGSLPEFSGVSLVRGG